MTVKVAVSVPGYSNIEADRMISVKYLQDNAMALIIIVRPPHSVSFRCTTSNTNLIKHQWVECWYGVFPQCAVDWYSEVRRAVCQCQFREHPQYPHPEIIVGGINRRKTKQFNRF